MKFIEIETSTGMTCLDLEHVSAFTYTRKTGMLKKTQYDISIHMISGTIFTGVVGEEKFQFIQDELGCEWVE